MEGQAAPELDEKFFRSFGVAFVFKEPLAGLDFSFDGSLVCLHNDHSVFVLATSDMKTVKTLDNFINGISKLRFCRSSKVVAFSPLFSPFDVFLWLLYENLIVACFIGGDESIHTLVSNKAADVILTVDEAGVIRLYDITTAVSDCAHSVPAEQRGRKSAVKTFDHRSSLKAAADFDESGLVMITVVSSADVSIELHNLDGGYRGVFSAVVLKNESPVVSVKLDSKNARAVFIHENNEASLFRFSTQTLAKINAAVNCKTEPCFSPDFRFLLAGGGDCVNIIDLASRKCAAKHQTDSCRIVRFFPCQVSFVSVGNCLIVWSPKLWTV